MRIVVSLVAAALLATPVNAATSTIDQIKHPTARERHAWCQTRCQMQFGQQVCNTYCFHHEYPEEQLVASTPVDPLYSDCSMKQPFPPAPASVAAGRDGLRHHRCRRRGRVAPRRSVGTFGVMLYLRSPED